MSDFLQDVRYAARLFVQQPGFTAIIVLVLALGIGATTAIFSVVDAVLLRPLPYADAGRLVSVLNDFRRAGLRGSISAPDFHDWQEQARSFEALAAYQSSQTSVSIDGAADYAVVSRVTPAFFPLMRARPVAGRLLSDEEQRAGGPMTALVSDAFARSHLGGTRDAIGRAIRNRGGIYTVVGVLPPAFNFPARTDVWTAWWMVPETTSRSAHNYRAVGRLKDGVSLAQAQAEMDGIAEGLARVYPQSNENKGVLVDLLQDQLVRNVRTTLNLIFGVVIVVLLIACANVSNLLLARASARTRELGVRAAIGATRGRVIRQLVTESALLAVVAGALGIFIAVAGMRGLLAMAPAGLPRLDEVAVDGRMLTFALLAALSSSFAFGLVPALQISRIDLNEVLKQAGRGASRAAGARARASLIVFETAAAVVLVIAASLLVRSFAALSAADMGFDTTRLLIADTSVPASDLESAKRAIRFYRDLVPRLAQVPGVVAASAVSAVLTVVKSNGGYVVEGGRTFEQMGTTAPQALFTVVTPGYFRTIGIAVKSGRDVADGDVDGVPLVAMVNEAFRRAAFGGGEAIGQRIMTGMDMVTGPDGTRFARIVGVVADVRSTDPSLAPQPQIYVPYQQHPNFSTALTLVLRTSSDPLQAAAQTQQIVRGLNPDVPVKVSTMESTLGVAVSAPRFRTILLALFAVLALVLAMAGVYGLVSFTVSQRMGEMGLRMALGAQRSEIVRMTLASGVRLTAIGCALGWLMAFGLARVLGSMLYEVTARDPVVFVAAPVVLIGVACLASIAPALKASRVDPSVALRVE